MIYERFDRNPLANPVAIAIAIVATVITLIDMPYAKYFEGAQFVHFLLGTATVALAVPIYKGLDALRGRIVPLLAALLAGGATSIVSAVGIAKLLGRGRGHHRRLLREVGHRAHRDGRGRAHQRLAHAHRGLRRDHRHPRRRSSCASSWTRSA